MCFIWGIGEIFLLKHLVEDFLHARAFGPEMVYFQDPRFNLVLLKILFHHVQHGEGAEIVGWREVLHFIVIEGPD